MKIFAYINSNEFKKTTLLNLQLKKKRINLIKNIFVGVFSFFCIVMYGVIVNITSTQGYFLNKAQQEKQKVKFSYNIETLNISEYQTKLWNSLLNTQKIRKISFNGSGYWQDIKLKH